MEFVAYYRVSTEDQGKSGLGLAAQREAVKQFLGQDPAAEFQDVESGKSDKNRPELQKAIDLCKRKKKAKLCIAKLDRLSRSVAFIATLMESGVEFVACDNPHANELTIHILAAVAMAERKMISTRIKEALAQINLQLAAGIERTGKKSKLPYTKLGNPRLEEAREKALKAKYPNPVPAATVESMQRWSDDGLTLRQIAAKLNEMNCRTPRSPRYPEGCIWHACTVRKVLRTAPAAVAEAA